MTAAQKNDYLRRHDVSATFALLPGEARPRWNIELGSIMAMLAEASPEFADAVDSGHGQQIWQDLAQGIAEATGAELHND